MATDPFARICRLAATLPGIEPGTSYRTPALKVRGKLLCRLKEDGETLVLCCSGLDEKEFLLQTEPDLFFETDHYKGWAAVLVRLDRIDDARLQALITQAWEREAGKRLLAARAAASHSP
jgi:hypothetical protein